MVLVNEVLQMKQQGLSDQEIVRRLKEQGFSPLEITKALEQSKIKEEVGKISGENAGEKNKSIEDMQPSVMETNEELPQYTPPTPQPTPQPVYEQQEQYPVQEATALPQQPYDYYGYEQEYGYQTYQPQSTETITEITEQIVEEKIDEIRKKISEMSNFKISVEKRINDIDERLDKVENLIQELQIKILDKVSTYSQNLELMKKEMEVMQDSFSKIVNPIIDLAREMKKKRK